MSLSRYESLKAQWIAKNTQATPDQYMFAMIQLARSCGI
jgi:hypothetical protein